MNSSTFSMVVFRTSSTPVTGDNTKNRFAPSHKRSNMRPLGFHLPHGTASWAIQLHHPRSGKSRNDGCERFHEPIMDDAAGEPKPLPSFAETPEGNQTTLDRTAAATSS